MGGLIWLTQTKLDSLYVVSHVSRYMNVLQQVHLEATKKNINISKGHRTLGSFFHMKQP
jgi:hypothetical protein